MQTKITFSEESRMVLRWLAKEVYWLENEGALVKLLIQMQIPNLVKEHQDRFPGKENLQARYSDAKSKE